MVNDRNRDPHFDWPYSTSYLLETLDPELIEAHAEHILSRTLNIGRGVGFIGAGVAMSYGRISWQTLVQTELKRVKAKLEIAQDFKDWKTDKANDARRLWQTLDTLKISRTDIKSERYPMLFQVSEQLDHALNKFLDHRDDNDGVRAHATKLTIDDQGHAYQILLDALCYDQEPHVNVKTYRATEAAAREFIKKILSGESVELVKGPAAATQPGATKLSETAHTGADAKNDASDEFEPHLPVELLEKAFNGKTTMAHGQPIDDSAYRLFFDTKYIVGAAPVAAGLQNEKKKSSGEPVAPGACLLEIAMTSNGSQKCLADLREAIEYACGARPANSARWKHRRAGPEIPSADGSLPRGCASAIGRARQERKPTLATARARMVGGDKQHHVPRISTPVQTR